MSSFSINIYCFKDRFCYIIHILLLIFNFKHFKFRSTGSESRNNIFEIISHRFREIFLRSHFSSNLTLNIELIFIFIHRIKCFRYNCGSFLYGINTSSRSFRNLTFGRNKQLSFSNST